MPPDPSVRYGSAYAVLATVVLLPVSAAAQGALSGIVRDSARGIGIAGADLRIDGTAFRALTDDEGRFHFADGTATSATLDVRRLGYVPRRVVVAAEAASSPVEIGLVAAAEPLPAVTVRAQRTRYSGRLAGYYERLERRPIGTFITRGDLERERPSQISDMIQRMPGVDLLRGRPGGLHVRMRGRDCSPLIWLDGAALSVGDVDLDAFSPATLEGVEMYLGAASAPQVYQAARGKSECGTILLWSRGPDTEPSLSVRPVQPADLEALIASLAVFTADQVDRPAVLDSASLPGIEYPAALRAAATSGVVLAELVVDSAGHAEPEYFGVVSATDPLFTAAVRQTLGTLRFRPALRRGRPVRQIVRLPFEFAVPGRDGTRR